jgi:hypothetical protein
VKVTDWPTVEGFADDDTVVVEAGTDTDSPGEFENAEVFPAGSVTVAV